MDRKRHKLVILSGGSSVSASTTICLTKNSFKTLVLGVRRTSKLFLSKNVSTTWMCKVFAAQLGIKNKGVYDAMQSGYTSKQICQNKVIFCSFRRSPRIYILQTVEIIYRYFSAILSDASLKRKISCIAEINQTKQSNVFHYIVCSIRTATAATLK